MRGNHISVTIQQDVDRVHIIHSYAFSVNKQELDSEQYEYRGGVCIVYTDCVVHSELMLYLYTNIPIALIGLSILFVRGYI